VSRLVLRPTQPSIQRVPRDLNLEVKRPQREVDHSPPSSAEVKNLWSYSSTSPVHRLISWLQILRFPEFLPSEHWVPKNKPAVHHIHIYIYIYIYSIIVNLMYKILILAAMKLFIHRLCNDVVSTAQFIWGCIQKFPDWPPGARTANDTALCSKYSCIAILWVSLVSFAAIILCVASQRVFIFVVYFVIDSVRKLLDTPSWLHMSWEVCCEGYVDGDLEDQRSGLF
jgi:hypothetical protein